MSSLKNARALRYFPRARGLAASAVAAAVACSGGEPDTVIYIGAPGGGSSGSNGSAAIAGAGAANGSGGVDGGGDGGLGGSRSSRAGESGGGSSGAAGDGGASSGSGGSAAGAGATGGSSSGGAAAGAGATGGSSSGGAAGSSACTLNDRRCFANRVELCTNLPGGWRADDDCDGFQFCDPATLSCRTMACPPTAPSCDNNRATVCNASGSGYELGGTECGSLACVDGTCREPIFRENFETGFGAFGFNDVDYRVELRQPGANGTGQYVLVAGRDSASTSIDGIWAQFPTNRKPRAVSFWIKAMGAEGGTSVVTFSSSTQATDDLMWIGFFHDFIRLYARDGQFRDLFELAAYDLDRWYHVEYRNIDWEGGEFDYYIDGVMLQTGLDLDSLAGMRHIAVIGDGSLQLGIDEIELR